MNSTNFMVDIFRQVARFCKRLYVNSTILEAEADLASD
jgi:hypothetical protein